MALDLHSNTSNNNNNNNNNNNDDDDDVPSRAGSVAWLASYYPHVHAG